MEYSRKQTDLVLDYLEDQLDKGGIDPELKKKFGWTDAEFGEFVRRHRQLRDKSQLPGDEGREASRELDDTLRSLGLSRPGEQTRTGQPKTEKAVGLRQTTRSRPPRAFQEKSDAFRKDVISN